MRAAREGAALLRTFLAGFPSVPMTYRFSVGNRCPAFLGIAPIAKARRSPLDADGVSRCVQGQIVNERALRNGRAKLGVGFSSLRKDL